MSEVRTKLNIIQKDKVYYMIENQTLRTQISNQKLDIKKAAEQNE